jgi:chromosome partitioning protein
MVNIVVASNKGGVGKSTAVINIAAVLGKAKKRVLVVDMDIQGNATSGLAVDKWSLKMPIIDALSEGKPLSNIIVKSVYGVDVLGNNLHGRHGVPVLMSLVKERELVLRKQLDVLKGRYDVVLIDSPPTLDVLSYNAVFAGDWALVPVLLEPYAFEGMGRMFKVVKEEAGLRCVGFANMVRNDYALSKEMIAEITKTFSAAFCKTTISRSVKVPELQWDNKPIALSAHEVGNQYFALVKELGLM